MNPPIFEKTKVGDLREQIWSDLVRSNTAAFPLPPHGHNPNFKGARAAAKHLLTLPLLESAGWVLIGMEAVLLPLRGLLLEANKTIVVPHRTKSGCYWELKTTDKAAARIENFHVFGTACNLEMIQIIVLASVAVALDGGRLSKGFGFGAKNLLLNVPTLSLAHPSMVFTTLGELADSSIIGFATPEALILSSK